MDGGKVLTTNKNECVDINMMLFSVITGQRRWSEDRDSGLDRGSRWGPGAT